MWPGGGGGERPGGAYRKRVETGGGGIGVEKGGRPERLMEAEMRRGVSLVKTPPARPARQTPFTDNT